MKDYEMVFLLELVQRKCRSILGNRNLYGMSKENLSSLFGYLKNHPSKKRFEENMKFIFKIVVKKLKEKFMQENDIAFWNKSFESQFYHYYFKELS